MSWSNIKLIFFREARDQLRDRRTLFMIAVLPILLYPLMGIVILKVLEFQREYPARVWLAGAENLPTDPELLVEGRFSDKLSDNPKLLELVIDEKLPAEGKGLRSAAEEALHDRGFDAVVFIPSGFASELEKFRKQIDGESPGKASETRVPKPEVYANLAADSSRTAQRRVENVLHLWKQQVVARTLKERDVPVEAVKPFEVTSTDVAAAVTKQAVVWSKILPFIVLIWALTGAFYPAIDLCAGEKERGTLETLLSSPAQRSEIVMGKLLTVMTFSIATSLLNLASMVGMSRFVISRLDVAGMSLQVGPPPLVPMVWLVLAVIPIAAFFSALSLAIAAFAKSSKEGQYYLMPLLLFSMPLMIFPIMPGSRLEMGTAIIPVTGIMFLLRALMEGQYAEALRYVVPVLGVTALCCWMAARWAVDQFNNESVLFRESERFDLRLWLRQLFRDRGETPTTGAAIFCGILILIAQFIYSIGAASEKLSFASLSRTTLFLQIGIIAGIAILMSLLLSRNPRKTLSLTMPRWQTLPLAVALAILVHPLTFWLSKGISSLYPLDEKKAAALQGLQGLFVDQPWWVMVLLLAVTPAICEELAFRGFILSGMRHTGHRWLAIAVSSLFFAVTHTVLQQQIAAFFVGLLIGYIAVRSSSLLPGMLFHVTHNTLLVTMAAWLPWLLERAPWLNRVVHVGETDVAWHPAVLGICAVLATGLLYWLHRQPYAESAEEKLQHALDHQSPALMGQPEWKLW